MEQWEGSEQVVKLSIRRKGSAKVEEIKVTLPTKPYQPRDPEENSVKEQQGHRQRGTCVTSFVLLWPGQTFSNSLYYLYYCILYIQVWDKSAHLIVPETKPNVYLIIHLS